MKKTKAKDKSIKYQRDIAKAHNIATEAEVFICYTLPCFFSLSNGLAAGINISTSSGTFLTILTAANAACEQINIAAKMNNNPVSKK